LRQRILFGRYRKRRCSVDIEVGRSDTENWLPLDGCLLDTGYTGSLMVDWARAHYYLGVPEDDMGGTETLEMGDGTPCSFRLALVRVHWFGAVRPVVVHVCLNPNFGQPVVGMGLLRGCTLSFDQTCFRLCRSPGTGWAGRWQPWECQWTAPGGAAPMPDAQ